MGDAVVQDVVTIVLMMDLQVNRRFQVVSHSGMVAYGRTVIWEDPLTKSDHRDPDDVDDEDERNNSRLPGRVELNMTSGTSFKTLRWGSPETLKSQGRTAIRGVTGSVELVTHRTL